MLMVNITRPLDVAHFPAPQVCIECGQMTAFHVGDKWACTSTECDPAAATWCLLDALFRVLAGERK